MGRVAGGEETRDEVLEKVLLRREEHRGRSWPVRGAVVVAGGLLGVLGAVLSVVTPELGLPLLLFGLRLLALEFDWAARAYARVEKLARRVGGRLRRLFRSRRGVVVAVVVVVGALVVGAVVVLP